jgi:hypothetical protein
MPPGSKPDVDPIERYVPLALKLALYFVLSLLLYQAATAFAGYVPGQPTPFMLAILRTFIFLPLHEGGHFLFSMFGKMLYILGGSFWQIVFPLAWFVMAARQRSSVAPFALFWVGENMMDVSLYMRDAPLRQLPLLGGHTSGHDWYNLFTMWNVMDSAGTIADFMYYLGLITCATAIGAGFLIAVRAFMHPKAFTLPDDE